MVRTYRHKNRYEKWSKLTSEQTSYLLRMFFHPTRFEQVAEQAQVSSRTVSTKYAAINERILTDIECRSALIDYLSPELVQLHWISRNEDLVPESDFWDRLYTCYFNCPAIIEPALQLSFTNRRAFAPHIREMMAEKGVIRTLKVKCAACPAQSIRASVTFECFALPKGFLSDYGLAARRHFRPNLFRFFFFSAVALRASAAREQAEEEKAKEAYHSAMTRGMRDLAVILAHHLAQEPLVS